MGVKVQIKLTGTVWPTDMRSLAQSLSSSTEQANALPQDSRSWKIFENIRMEEFRNELSFTSKESPPAIRAAFHKAFSQTDFFVKPKEGEPTSETLIRRPVGYELKFVG